MSGAAGPLHASYECSAAARAGVLELCLISCVTAPVAACCRLLSSAGTTLAAFAVGALGTVLGTIVAYSLIGPQLGPEGWKVAAALCASYIGGSLNFAAVSQALALAPGPLLAGAMTADNCVMALYIAAIMSIPAEGSSELPGAGGSASTSSSSAQPAVAAASTAESMALSIAAAAVACTLGNHLAAAAGFGSSGLAVMALLASGIAMLGSRLAAWAASRRSSSGSSSSSSSSSSSAEQQQQPKQQVPFVGAEALGGALMMLFFATIGAAAGSLRSLQGCGWLLLFILLQLRCGGMGMGCCD